MTAAHKTAWGDFWAANSHGGDEGSPPAGWRGIEAAQKQAWRHFAGMLPRSARLIDLGTGDGRVMRWLLEERADLRLLGVDFAEQLPQAPRGSKIRSGVRMEALPFPDAHFSAACSQFGMEYGDVGRIAQETARVLRPDGLIGLMTHRKDGPIMQHNLARREQIRWALQERDLIAIAKRSLTLRAAGISAPPAIVQAPDEGARKFGRGSVGWELPEAIRRTMVLGSRDAAANVARLLDDIASRAANELARIASLEQACAQANDESGMDAAFDRAGLVVLSRQQIAESPSLAAFADFRILHRRA